jgi:hypothetical protein
MYARGWNPPITPPSSRRRKRARRSGSSSPAELNPNYQSRRPAAILLAMSRHRREEPRHGPVLEDASIKMDPDNGTIIMDSYASAPRIFPTVQLVVKKAKKKSGD